MCDPDTQTEPDMFLNPFGSRLLASQTGGPPPACSRSKHILYFLEPKKKEG
ncbi:unnamed protein product [Ectocarpus sp. CCAP 1310/34]|nr:unnamed protein product [Ectocarpus sp. CCAP 1310/34]